MGTLEIIILSFSFFLFPATITSEKDCPAYQCSENEPIIRFPFRLKGYQRERCGYSGFDLFCDSRNKTVLKVPLSGEFSVRSIDYATREIQIYDEANCVPKRLMNLNLSSSPFKGVYYDKYEFFNCSSVDLYRYRSLFTPIHCLSSNTNTVLVSGYESLVAVVWTCESIANVSVPRPVYPTYDVPYELEDDLLLTWGEPDCRSCEIMKGKCGFVSSTSSGIGCFRSPRQGFTKSTISIISIGIGIPALISFIWCIRLGCKDYGGGSGSQNNFELSIAIPPSQSIIATVGGIDDSTLQSYLKVVLGESRRLPNPEYTTCSICLSEYQPQETLKSIPECKHCFHGDCIDEWLRINATCPVCRTSPIQQ